MEPTKAEVVKALRELVSMVERYEHAELSQEPLVQLFAARDILDRESANGS